MIHTAAVVVPAAGSKIAPRYAQRLCRIVYDLDESYMNGAVTKALHNTREHQKGHTVPSTEVGECILFFSAV